MVTRMRHFWARQQRRMTTRLLTWVVVALAAPVDAQPVAIADDETAIRNARRESNRAIAAHDLAGIARHWMPDVHIVTSTSTQGSGRDVNGQRMGQQFVRRPDTVYVRTPATVDVLAAVGSGSRARQLDRPLDRARRRGRHRRHLPGAVAQGRRRLADPGRSVRAGHVHRVALLHRPALTGARAETRPHCQLPYIGLGTRK